MKLLLDIIIIFFFKISCTLLLLMNEPRSALCVKSSNIYGLIERTHYIPNWDRQFEYILDSNRSIDCC